MAIMMKLLLLLAVTAIQAAWIAQPDALNCKASRTSRGSIALRMNLFDAFTGKTTLRLVEEIPYGDPILPVRRDDSVVLAIAERGISFTGEDFDVVDCGTKSNVCHVRGAMLHLPGKDKMRIVDSATGQKCAELDRKLVAVTPTYDIYRGKEKIGWIEKVVVAFRDTFEVHLENVPKIGPFKPPAAYKLEGDFLDRKFIMKTDQGNTVAVVSKDGWFPQFDAFNHYQVQVAPGMDMGLVVACACAIDEEFDEEHQKRAEERKEQGGGGWFG